VSLMLRLRLVECLRSLAIQVELLQAESEDADFWANRLITAARRSPERLVELRRSWSGTIGADGAFCQRTGGASL